MRLFGKNPVIERLRSHPESIGKIHLEPGAPDAAYIRKKAHQHGIPVILVHKSKMEKLGRDVNAQGVMVDVANFEYMPYKDLLEQALLKHRTLIFLDALNDPQNLGAIIRSAGCFGGFSIILPTHKSVKVTEAVLRVASGGENHVFIAQVANLRNAIRLAKDAGFHIAATVVSGGQPLEDTQLPFPMGIVIGSEQKGVRDINKKEVDLELTIPMYIDRLSFNVAHATTILCYEITRQKILYKKNRASREQPVSD